MKILLLIRSLEYGGTERQLVELAKGLNRRGHSIKVMEFYPGGALEKDLHTAGVPIQSLDKSGRWDVVPFFHKLMHIVRRERPQILYAFLGVPCILSVLLKPFFPQMKIVWGVRASNVDLGKYGRLFRYAYKLECCLSRFADLIIANSLAGKHYAIKHGFPQDIEVIPNGINIGLFKPDPFARQRIREQWNVNNNDILIGQVSRLDPIKDHHSFFTAASLVASKCSAARFVCVGNGPAGYVSELRAAARACGIHDKTIWAGERSDMPDIYNALDLLVSSSHGEGFPNVIAEAMACGVPCVTTDAGDCAWIVGETGIVVPCQNPEGLADGILMMLRKEEFLAGNLKRACSQRINGQYTDVRLVDRTETALERLVCSE